MTSSASGSAPDHGGHRTFTGNDEGPQEYKRWKAWISSKLLTMEKLPTKAYGAYMHTTLSGKALEADEHLTEAEFQCEGGEKKILELLDKRFPPKETTDEMAEHLGKVFSLHAKEGESLRAWTARAQEAFEHLQRKTQASFPDEARGWVVLHRSGLNAEQQAIVVSRSRGSMKISALNSAMRSCYPDFVYKGRKSYGASVAQNEEGPLETMLPEEDEPLDLFDDVEQLLAEHQAPAEDTFDEQDTAEALAITWKERRQDTTRLKNARRFDEAGKVRRQFRIEVEELKRRTRCHKRNQLGHWSRECPRGKGGSKGDSQKSKGATGSTSAASYVEHFVAMVHHHGGGGLLDRVRALRQLVTPVSSPGFGILDSGCGRTILGKDSFAEFVELWKDRGVESPQPFEQLNHFRFGNGA